MLKKFLFTLIFILFFILLFNIDVFGFEVSFTDKDDNEIIAVTDGNLSFQNYAICQSGDTIVLINTSVDKLNLRFSNSTWTNKFDGGRLYVHIYYYDSESNSFIFKANYFGIDSSILTSNGFSCLYCTTNFLIYCEHDDYGFFADHQVIGYTSNYTLSLEYEVIDSGYRIFTNFFAIEQGIQGYWNPYIWTLDDPYTPLEDCDPVRWFWLGVF